MDKNLLVKQIDQDVNTVPTPWIDPVMTELPLVDTNDNVPGDPASNS